MKLISWNVNGLRSVLGKGLLEFWNVEKPDVLCLQEIKAKPEQVAEVTWPGGFAPHWNSAEKPGYAGTATFSQKKPQHTTSGIGLEEHKGPLGHLRSCLLFLTTCRRPKHVPRVGRSRFSLARATRLGSQPHQKR
jgi:exodeoxyribonuclease-3